MAVDESDLLLIAQIRKRDSAAWQECINRFEGRLFAFVQSRLNNKSTSEDVVQETFMGFLISLPNFDERTPIESYLFSIAAHKLTDVLRREGRRPTLPLSIPRSSVGNYEPPGNARKASSMARSSEQRITEQLVLAECLRELIEGWREQREFERLKCIELLFVLGWSNKHVAQRLATTEQAVANHKHFVVHKLKSIASTRLRNVDLSAYGLE